MKLIEALNFQTHAEVEKFGLEFGLEYVITGNLIKEKETSLIRHLIQNSGAVAPSGTPLAQAIIEHLIAKRCEHHEPKEQFPELVYSVDKDERAIPGTLYLFSPPLLT